MKKPIFFMMGLIHLAIISGQTYMIYNLYQQINRSNINKSVSTNFNGTLFTPISPADNFFEKNPPDSSKNPGEYKMKLKGNPAQVFPDSI